MRFVDSTEQIILNFVKELGLFLNSRLEYFETFTKHGVQVEGWLKGELLNFLEKGNLDGVLGFDREVKVGLGQRKVDFVLHTKSNGETEKAFIELKHWLIGFQKGIRWTANSYFRDASSVGINIDVEKLSKLTGNGFFILILATASPDKEDWASGIQKFNSKFPIKVEALTNPDNYPSTFFLGLLKVSQTSITS